MALIELQGIEKSYRDGENRLNHVLRGVNLELEDGEFIAVKGASGSGKTTLLRILGAAELPDKGTYRMGNMEVRDLDCLHIVRNKDIGFVFQDYRLMPQYTVLQNILLPTLATADESRPEEVEYARRLMELTHISALADQYPATLSGGEASRAAICRALIRKPLLLLADEPTGQLDRANALNIVSLFVEINRSLGTTIVMVTHSDETASFARRILTLEGGILR
ncbi:ABC transporter ATP-binding protein [Parabacteroides sp. ZJ-118]|uniref:ABC transporter ATP-binding protein n=1 Tax=Parabacteroides sp. ZJ-118 TaxID=2709398 RepID=UPI0013ECCD46|nr:ABC transporter ATP-binding protein [Parabacteroides sp. ZJ-118]